MKVLLDMNLSPQFKAALQDVGHEVEHWSEVGAPSATDFEVMSYARQQGMVVVTHDLDFADILLATGASGPSVLQLRARRLDVGELSSLIDIALQDCQKQLEGGALVTLDTARRRVRILPLGRPDDSADR